MQENTEALAAQPPGALDPQTISQPHLLCALTALYVGFGAVLGLIQGGLPVLIMASGWGPGQAGWAYLFYMPFGLAFLWGPLVDRKRLPLFSKRLGWVLWMQAVAVLALVTISQLPASATVTLACLGFAAAFAMATMDLALDGVAVEAVDARVRPWAAGTKLAGLATGSMIGGGVLVARFDSWGQETSFLLLAALLALAVLPYLLLRLPEAAGQNAHGGASLFRLFADKTGRRRLLLLVIVALIIFPASGLNRMMLVAIGIPLEQIGWLVGTLGPVGMIAASALAVPVMKAFGYRAALLVFGGISLASILLMLAGVAYDQPFPALTGAVVIGGSVGGIFIVYAAKILGWARGDQPVTDYSAFYGIGRFFAAIAMVLAAQAVQAIGWTLYFSLLAGVFVLLLLYFLKKETS